MDPISALAEPNCSRHGLLDQVEPRLDAGDGAQEGMGRRGVRHRVSP